MVKRYCARIAFDGHKYCGYQRQPNALSIQEKIETSFATIFNEKVSIVGCGRTDAGVHAKDYYFHFDTTYVNPIDRVHNINGLLGPQIALKDIENVSTDFHARFDAISREYEYLIHIEKDPFICDWSFYLKGIKHHLQLFDIDLLHSTAELFLKYNDFFSFCKTNTDVKTTICEVSKSKWEIKDSKWSYHVKANRFLRGMVRLMVGAMINVAREKLSIDEVEFCLINGKRLSNNWSVPAHGLYLVDIQYEQI